jgi:hypothetical protein
MGEVISDEWELVHTEVVTDENEEFDFTKLSQRSRETMLRLLRRALRTIKDSRYAMPICL